MKNLAILTLLLLSLTACKKEVINSSIETKNPTVDSIIDSANISDSCMRLTLPKGIYISLPNRNDTLFIDSTIKTSNSEPCSYNTISYNTYDYCTQSDTIKLQYIGPCKLYIASYRLRYSLRNNTLYFYESNPSFNGIYYHMTKYNYLKIK